MKKIFFLLSLASLVLVSCEKFKDNPPYGLGNAGSKPVLTSSKLVVAPTAADVGTKVLDLAWSFNYYATDTSTLKFIVQIDSTGRNFSKAVTREITAKRSTSFLAEEFNAVLVALGFSFDVPYDVDVRVISSYANNNERYESNIVKIRATAYRVPPRIPVPAALYIVGNLNGWNNSSSLDTKYQFYKTDITTYQGVFYFDGTGVYKLIQTLGNWDTQYRYIDGGSALGGSFKQENSDPAFPTPTTAGWYRVTVDFQNATFSLAPATERKPTPPALYIVGDLNGWNNNPGLNPIYQFTQDDAFSYSLTLNFPGPGNYKLIQQLGNWGTQFHMMSGGNAFAGEFEQRDADPAFPNPATAGNYKINVNFATNLYSVKRL
jgi:hypothetical protein